MDKNDPPGISGADIAAALSMLSRLPVPAAPSPRTASAWAWPVAGAILGLLAALLTGLLLAFSVPAAAAAALALAALAMATGAMHEDGLADCADGFWGGRDRQHRLEIMRDSRVGSYGVLALVLVVLVRWSALAALFDAGHVFGPLVAAAALSRLPMAVIAARLAPARADGLSSGFGQPGQDTVLLAGAAALLVALLFAGFAAFGALLAAGLGGWVVAALARARIGGQTGDVLGASQQVAEAAALVALAAYLA